MFEVFQVHLSPRETLSTPTNVTCLLLSLEIKTNKRKSLVLGLCQRTPEWMKQFVESIFKCFVDFCPRPLTLLELARSDRAPSGQRPGLETPDGILDLEVKVSRYFERKRARREKTQSTERHLYCRTH